MKIFEFVVSTDRDLEQEVIKDLKENFNIDAETRGRKAKVFFRGTILDAIRLNFACRSINRVVLILNQSNISTLEDVYKIVKEVSWDYYLPKKSSINIAVSRVGLHPFTSMDARMIAFNAIKDSIAKDFKVSLDVKNPDVIIRLDIIDDEIIVGIDLTGPSLHMRRYRAWNHPMPLKTTLAYLMVRISGWRYNEHLVDPMCGGGTILIEAAHKACNIPICLFRKGEYAFWKLPFIPLEKAQKLLEELLSKIRFCELKLSGSDINPDYVEGARKNAEKAKVGDYIKFQVADARDVSKIYGRGSIDVIVTNPPYRLLDRAYLIDLYEKFINSALDALNENGRLVMITSEMTLTEKILKGRGIIFEQRRTFRYGRTPCKIYTIHK